MVLFHRNANFFHVWLNRRQLDSHILQCVVIRCLETFYFLNLFIYFCFWLGCVFVAVQVFLQFPQAAATLQLQCRQPTPVGLPGKSHGWRSLVGYSSWGVEETDTAERLHFLLLHNTGSSSCGMWAQRFQFLGSRKQAQYLWHTGLGAPQHVGSSQTREGTRVSLVGGFFTRESLETFSMRVGKGEKYVHFYNIFSAL